MSSIIMHLTVFLAALLLALAAPLHAQRQKAVTLEQESLDLSWERIGAVGLESILAIIEQSNIIHLDLSNNFFDIECFKILMQILLVPSKLTSLNLSNNDISVEAARFLGQGLAGNSVIEKLFLSHTSLQADGVRHIVDAFGKNSRLKVLDISHCNIGDEGAVKVASFLQRSSTLQSLTVSSNDIRHEGGVSLFSALNHNTAIQHFYYGPGNQLTRSAMYHLAGYLLMPQSTLQTLDLSGTGITASSVQLLGEALQHESVRLKELILKANDLSTSAKAFFTVIKDNRHLRLLDVSACHIDAGASYAVAGLISGPGGGIETLNIAFNRLMGNGARVVFDSLRSGSRVKNLDISGNAIQSTFLDSFDISDSVFSPNLVHLRVGQNNIGDRGVIALVDLVKSSLTLTHLELDFYNEISDKGAAYVAKNLLRSNISVLQILDLSGNIISDKGGRLILKSLEFRRDNRLRTVEVKVAGNKLSDSLLQLISAFKKVSDVSPVPDEEDEIIGALDNNEL